MAAAALALACSVYESPNESSDALNGGSAGSGGSDPSGVAGATSGSDSGATAGAPSATAGTNAGEGSFIAGAGGVGGEPIDPGAGGEGGALVEPDACPNDPVKLEPGACGCGVPDEPGANLADCQTLESLLVHRYDFEGTGTAVMDRVGAEHGTIERGAALSQLDGTGVVQLEGGSAGSYVNLPNGLISALSSASIEAWVTWGGGSSWQRIFDFGDSTAAKPEDNPANGDSYIYVTPQSNGGVALAGFSLGGNSGGQEVQVLATSALAQSLKQVVVVADSSADKLLLYIDGAKVSEQPWTGELSGINDVNVWLGRSQYVGDMAFKGVIHEFRIYGAALTAPQIASAFAAGTDPGFLAD
jgi:hypothetical protein